MAAPSGLIREAGHELVRVLRAAAGAHLDLRQRLLAIGIATVAVDVVCAVIAYLVERHGPQTEIHTLWDAFFWTSTQLLTVSSQMKNPVSTGGRLLDIFMQAYAITVVASLAGSFGAFFHSRSIERSS